MNLGTRLGWAVSFMPRPLYPRGKYPSTHLIRYWMDGEPVRTLWRTNSSVSLTDDILNVTLITIITSKEGSMGLSSGSKLMKLWLPWRGVSNKRISTVQGSLHTRKLTTSFHRSLCFIFAQSRWD
jgi:hypothetical protein